MTNSTTLTVRQWLSTKSFEEAYAFGRLAIANVDEGVWP